MTNCTICKSVKKLNFGFKIGSQGSASSSGSGLGPISGAPPVAGGLPIIPTGNTGGLGAQPQNSQSSNSNSQLTPLALDGCWQFTAKWNDPILANYRAPVKTYTFTASSWGLPFWATKSPFGLGSWIVQTSQISISANLAVGAKTGSGQKPSVQPVTPNLWYKVIYSPSGVNYSLVTPSAFKLVLVDLTGSTAQAGQGYVLGQILSVKPCTPNQGINPQYFGGGAQSIFTEAVRYGKWS
jgi:hypothetical protein